MDLMKLKELNSKLLETSSSKVERALETKSWDCECFEVMAQAIDNMLDIHKIEKYSKESEELATVAVGETRGYTMPKQDAREVTTEFEKIIYDIVDSKPQKEAMEAITTTIAETMEDLRILHPRIYEMTIHRLKELM